MADQEEAPDVVVEDVQIDPEFELPTEEEQAEAKEIVKRLLDTNKEFHRAYLALVASKYLYFVARMETVRLLKSNTKNPHTETVTVRAASKQAESPLSLTAVRDATMQVLVPFIVETTHMHDDKEKKANADERQAAEAERAKRPIDLCDLRLKRGTPVVVVTGRSHFATFINANLELMPVDHDLRIVWITQHKLALGSERVFPIHSQKLAGAADSAERFLQRLTACVKGKVPWPTVDIVIVDDLLALRNEPIAGRPPERQAAETLQIMRKGMKELGATLLCSFPAVPLPTKEQLQTTDPHWGELVRRNRVYPLTAEGPNAEGNCLVTAGPLSVNIGRDEWLSSSGLILT